jgi:hypothetical protein
MRKKFNKLYTFKAKEDLKTDINSVITDEESVSSFIRKAIYNEIINRKKILKENSSLSTLDVFKSSIKPIIL